MNTAKGECGTFAYYNVQLNYKHQREKEGNLTRSIKRESSLSTYLAGPLRLRSTAPTRVPVVYVS